MHQLTLNSGRVVPCSIVTKALGYPVLHIYTKALTPDEIFNLFQDTDETIKMVDYDEVEQITKTYRFFTTLHSVSPTTMGTGEPEYRIWLDQNIPDDF